MNEPNALAPPTRPPLWRPRATPRSPFLFPGIALLLAFLGAWACLIFEHVLFASPAAPAVVTITTIETAHAGGEGPASLRYRVALADGSAALFATPNVYAVGDRLSAMVSRGRVTGRVFVTSPYAVLPRD